MTDLRLALLGLGLVFLGHGSLALFLVTIGRGVCREGYGVPVIGIPKTIDNDVYGTDIALGVDTALNTIVDAIDKIKDTASSHNRAFLIEVMGRASGYLVALGGLLY